MLSGRASLRVLKHGYGTVGCWKASRINNSVAVRKQMRAFRVAPPLLEAASKTVVSTDNTAAVSEKKKKRGGVMKQLWEFCRHLYHGMRLLAINTKIAARLKSKVIRGQQLTRRERQLLERTARDLIRMVPFSLFIIIPGAEILLPVALMMFPDLVPSTFSTREQTRKKQIIDNLKKGSWTRRVFEHQFARIIISEGYDLYSSSWGILKRVGKGDIVNADDIRELSVHYKPGKKLDLKNLPSWVLRDIARVMGIYNPIVGAILPKRLYDARLLCNIEQLFEQFQTDDKCLVEAGLENLNEEELELENVKRNMRWFGPASALRLQLKHWCEISLSEDIPTHILAFIRPCATQHRDMLKNLSGKEIESVVGLNKYEDSPMKKRLQKLTDEVQTVSTETMDQSFLDRDVEEIAKEAKQIREEATAAEDALKSMKSSLSPFSEAQLLGLFETVHSESGFTRPCDQEPGVKVVILAREMLRLLKELDTELNLTPYQLIMSLREFDIDSSDVITSEEFRSFLKRIKEQ